MTTIAYTHDAGVIPIGTLVNSHMIFLNSQGWSELTHSSVVWTFADPILAVMSDISGNFEAASTSELGAPGTNYTVPSSDAASFYLRGLEEDDSYLVAANQITVSMLVTEPGDWIRVVTVPEPATLAFLIFSGLALLAYGRRITRA